MSVHAGSLLLLLLLFSCSGTGLKSTTLLVKAIASADVSCLFLYGGVLYYIPYTVCIPLSTAHEPFSTCYQSFNNLHLFLQRCHPASCRRGSLRIFPSLPDSRLPLYFLSSRGKFGSRTPRQPMVEVLLSRVLTFFATESQYQRNHQSSPVKDRAHKSTLL